MVKVTVLVVRSEWVKLESVSFILVTGGVVQVGRNELLTMHLEEAGDAFKVEVTSLIRCCFCRRLFL